MFRPFPPVPPFRATTTTTNSSQEPITHELFDETNVVPDLRPLDHSMQRLERTLNGCSLPQLTGRQTLMAMARPQYIVDPYHRIPQNERETLYYVVIDGLPDASPIVRQLILTLVEFQVRVMPLHHAINQRPPADAFMHVGVATPEDALAILHHLRRNIEPDSWIQVMIATSGFD